MPRDICAFADARGFFVSIESRCKQSTVKDTIHILRRIFLNIYD